MGLRMGGCDERPDWPKLGPSLLIATCLVVAIRTARWPALASTTARDIDLDQEIEFAATISRRVLATLTKRWPTIFPTTPQPWYQPDGKDEPE